MIELLHRSAQDDPDGIALRAGDRLVTYGRLLGQALAAADALRVRGVRRAAVLDDDPAAVVAVLAAASLIGVETCVYPAAATREAVADLLARFDHDVLLTRRAELADLPASTATDELFAAAADTVPATLPQLPSHRPLLVLTTGTTGHPRAARHDWGRLLPAVARVVRTPDQRWLLAYGLNQFGGLQIVLHVLAAGATLVVPAALRPREGLDAMRAQGVTHASGTPTFWRFVLAELSADGGAVPSLRQVTLGGEAVPPALLERLRAVFPDARVSQIYGATEFGRNVTVRDGVFGLPVSMLDETADVALRVVDGQLWVRSRSSMLGYYGEEPIDPDAWRPTGDLVEVVGDRILFRGRASEIINVGGVKVHPAPIEERIGGLPGVAVARVFGRRNPMVGAIVAAEIVPAAGVDTDELDAQIRAACADLPPAHRPRRITFVETIATTGGKISRGMAPDSPPATGRPKE